MCTYLAYEEDGIPELYGLHGSNKKGSCCYYESVGSM